MATEKKTLVVNLFGGPGAGKTTCAWEIASKLKKLGYVTEYVGEYAKELVWDNRGDLLDGSLKNQTMLYEEQKRRVERLVGKVDFIVTDSPTILSLVYLKEPNAGFENRIKKDFAKHHNFCFFVERGSRFETQGRIHNEQESRAIDVEIKDLLEKSRIYYGTYDHQQIDLSIRNMQMTFQKLNGIVSKPSSLSDKIAEATSKRDALPFAESKGSFEKTACK